MQNSSGSINAESQSAKENLRVRLILPFRLPTWNQMLAMGLHQRIRVKKWIRNFVSTSIQDAGGQSTPTGFTVKPQLTDLQKAEYCRMITPMSSPAYRTVKKGLRRKKR